MPRTLITPCRRIACTITSVSCNTSLHIYPPSAPILTSTAVPGTRHRYQQIRGYRLAGHNFMPPCYELSETDLVKKQLEITWIFLEHPTLKTLSYRRQRCRKPRNRCSMVVSEWYKVNLMCPMLRKWFMDSSIKRWSWRKCSTKNITFPACVL